MARHPQVYGYNFRKARSVNQTSAAFVAKTPTATEPSGDAASATGASIIEIGQEDQTGRPNIAKTQIKIIPYGVGNDDDTFSVRIIGWTKTAGGSLWIPIPLAEILCTVSTVVGVSGKIVVNTERFADTLSLTYGVANVNTILNSPANNTVAMARVTVDDFQKIELSFQTGASATGCNALYSFS